MQCRFEPLYWCWSSKKCELFVATMKSEQNKKIGISQRKIEGKLGATMLPKWNHYSVMLARTYFCSKNRISDWHWPRCIWKKPLEAFLSFASTRYILSISIFGQNFGPLASGSMNENKTAHWPRWAKNTFQAPNNSSSKKVLAHQTMPASPFECLLCSQGI